MKKIIPVLLSIPLLMTGIAGATAQGDNTYYNNLGKCIAYTAVKAELDGKKEMEAETSKTLNQLGDEFLFEAANLKIPEQDAQNFIVYNLVNYNLQQKEKGIESLDQEHATKCAEIAKKLDVPKN